MASHLGHPSNFIANKFLEQPSLSMSWTNKSCNICLCVKQTQDVFLLSLNIASEPFDSMHCYLWGHIMFCRHSGSKYFLTILDDHFRYVCVDLFNCRKCEVADIIKKFLCYGANPIS